MAGQMTRLGLALLLLVTLAHSAAAGVCVTLDEQRDTLSPEDRRAAMITFGQALAKAGAQVTVGDCTTTYSLYNVKLGDAITVYAVGPGGTLLIVDHGEAPPWAKFGGHDHHHEFPSAQDVLAGLALDTAQWQPVRVGSSEREAVGPDGEHATLVDNVIELRRK